MRSIREHFSHRFDAVQMERRAWAADCCALRQNDPDVAGLRPVRVQSVGGGFLTTWEPEEPPPADPAPA